MKREGELEKFSRTIEEITFLDKEERKRVTRRKKEGTLAQPPRFRHILVAYDGSEGAQDALAWAKWIAKPHEATITLALVLPTTPESHGGGLTAVSKDVEGTIKAVLEDDEHYAKDMIESVKHKVKAEGIPCQGVVARGKPADEMLRLVGDHEADLVVLGPHRKRGLERLLMGSVSNTIAERAETSVLIARGEPPAKKILLAVDGSEISHKAAGALLSLPEHARTVHLVSVLPLPYAGFSDEARLRIQEASKKLHDAVDKRFEASPENVEYDLLFGKPAERILEVANEQQSELIVMGARGHSRMKGVFLGSVSHQVVHRAETSVLLVRAGKAEET